MRKPRIIAVNSNCYRGFTIEKAIAGIRDAGFHYVELAAAKGGTSHVSAEQSFARLAEIKELLEEKRLIPFSVGGHTNLMDPNRLHDFMTNIRLAHFFGSRYIVSSIGDAQLQDSVKAGNETVAEHIRGFLPLLKEYDMRIVLEVHGEHGTGRKVQEIVRQVNSPLVGINYDTANAIFYGGVDVEEDLSACLSDVRYLHIKDKAGETHEWNFPALGEGYVPFFRVFDRLEATDNLSPFSVEIEFTAKGPADLQEVNRAVQSSAAFLKAQGFEL